MDAALIGILDTPFEGGQVVAPRGMPTREVLGYTFRLTNPRARRIALPARKWKESLAVGEFCWHLSESDSAAFISYYAPIWARFSEDCERIASSCYGKRLFGGRPSQWERAREALVADPATRRSVLALIETAADPRSARDIACITSMQFILRGAHLNCITTMRSCDVIWGLCYDVYFCTMLQELMAAQIGADVGWYQHSAASLHIYDEFVSMAEALVEHGLVTEADPMPKLVCPEALPRFLAAEAALRLNRPNANEELDSLPPYWRNLASPLRRLHRRRWVDDDASTVRD